MACARAHKTHIYQTAWTDVSRRFRFGQNRRVPRLPLFLGGRKCGARRKRSTFDRGRQSHFREDIERLKIIFPRAIVAMPSPLGCSDHTVAIGCHSVPAWLGGFPFWKSLPLAIAAQRPAAGLSAFLSPWCKGDAGRGGQLAGTWVSPGQNPFQNGNGAECEVAQPDLHFQPCPCARRATRARRLRLGLNYTPCAGLSVGFHFIALVNVRVTCPPVSGLELLPVNSPSASILASKVCASVALPTIRAR